MRHIKTIVVGMVLAVSLSLMMYLLDTRPAEAQGDITGLLSAGTYVEDPATANPKIVVIYFDGNWTLFDPVTSQTLFGVWEERVGGPTDTDTETDTDTVTDTDTETDTTTDRVSVTLDAVLVGPAGTPISYTLQTDERFTSVRVTATTTQESFQATRVDTTEPEPPTEPPTEEPPTEPPTEEPPTVTPTDTVTDGSTQ
jgi:hypothetical protein